MSETIDDLGARTLPDEPMVPEEENKEAKAAEAKAAEEKAAEAKAAEEKAVEEKPAAKEAESEGEDTEEEPAKKRRPGKAARKITRLETELQETRERLARLEGPRGAEPATPKEDPEPKEGDFEDRDDFLVAKAEHRALKSFRAEQAAIREKDEASAAAKQKGELRSAHARRIEAARDNHEDYDEVVSAAADIQIPDSMAQALMESEQGAELVYHLAQNPDDARRISALSATGQARELGKIEARLEPAETPPRKITTAPTPPSKVKPSGSVPKNLETMDNESYRKARLGV